MTVKKKKITQYNIKTNFDFNIFVNTEDVNLLD